MRLISLLSPGEQKHDIKRREKRKYFYRVTQTWGNVSACSFLPRDAMRSAVFAVVRCPSVTLVYCIIQTTEESSNFFLDSVPHNSSFFDSVRRYLIPRGTPSARAQNTRGGKILRFPAEITVYLGNGTR